MNTSKIKNKSLQENNEFSENFYKNLPTFKKFSDLSLESNYHKAPSDWVLILTDIIGSTQAILSGKYKDVNIIGAACISAVEQVIKEDQCPSIFGGDGCSILIPKKYVPEVKKALSEVRNSAKDKFNLELRVNLIPVADLIDHGQSIKVGKFNLSHSKNVAKFSGGGLSYAEKLMKSSNKYEMEYVCSDYSDFKNLSCRWEPISNQNGKILTLIIQAKNFNSYSSILDGLSNIFGNDISKINPVKTDKMDYKSITKMLKDEKYFENNVYSFKNASRVAEIVLCYFMFKIFRNFLPSFLKKYIRSMETHSDFRKFDDTLRMVVDCNEAEIELVKQFCEHLYREEKIYFGLYTSENALMTCLVNNLNDGSHIHFIDGDGGGYALAAKNLKKQIKDKNS